jgi:ATP-dependent Clp protease ATP-binding subunit ClpA
MMFERFTRPARQIVVQSQEYARRLGHPFIGTEHLLLGAVTVDDPASALVRDLGVTPERVEAELLRLTKAADGGPATRMIGGLDREALASIGIDLDEVRTRIEATFGPGALTRAALNCPKRRRLLGRRRRPRGRTGPANQTAMIRGHIPLTRRAKKSFELSLREALRLGDNYIGVEHVTLALISMEDGLVPRLLTGLGVSAGTLRAALLDQHRKAS